MVDVNWFQCLAFNIDDLVTMIIRKFQIVVDFPAVLLILDFINFN